MMEQGQDAECAEVTNFLQNESLHTCKLHVVFTLAQEQGVERVSWNGFPWLTSCIQAIPQKVQCEVLDAVV